MKWRAERFVFTVAITSFAFGWKFGWAGALVAALASTVLWMLGETV